MQDFEREMIEEKKRQEEEGKRGAWNEVEIGKRYFSITYLNWEIVTSSYVEDWRSLKSNRETLCGELFVYLLI